MKGANENQYGKYKRWTKREISLLKKSYKLTTGKRELEILPELLKARTKLQCSDRAGRLGIRRKRGDYFISELDFSKISNEEIAYLAGIIDGEGTFEARRYDIRPTWKVSIINTSLEMLEWVVKKIGGKIYKRKRVLRSNGKEYRKQGYSYYLYGKKPMLSLLKKLLPYLIIKKEQATEIINYLEKN